MKSPTDQIEKPGGYDLSTFEGRLAYIIGDESVNAFGAKSKIRESSLRDYLKGTVKPGMEKLVAISEATGFNIHWLATGEGPSKTRAHKGTIVSDSESESYRLTTEEADKYFYIPLYDVEASAGDGGIVEKEEIIDLLAFSKGWLRNELRVSNPANLNIIYVKGESMEPTLRPGDIVLVDRGDLEISDGIYVLRLNGALLIKRLQRLPGLIVRVASDNPAYDSYTVNFSEHHELHLVGRVVWGGKRY